MFNECKKIIFLLLTSFSVFANDLDLTENGILSSLDNKIISKNIKKSESASYDLYFSYNKILGEILVFNQILNIRIFFIFLYLKIRMNFLLETLFV